MRDDDRQLRHRQVLNPIVAAQADPLTGRLALRVLGAASLLLAAVALRAQSVPGASSSYPRQPVGLYTFESDSPNAVQGRHMIVALIPDGPAFRLQGVWIDWAAPGDSAHGETAALWFTTPLTIFPDGRALGRIGNENLAGAFPGGGTGFYLTVTLPDAPRASGETWAFAPRNDAASLAEPGGVYAIQGAAGAVQWSGTIACIPLPAPSPPAASKWGRVFVALRSSSGGSMQYELDADITPQGRFVLPHAKVNGNDVTTDLTAAAGQLDGGIDIPIGSGYRVRVVIRGVKEIPG